MHLRMFEYHALLLRKYQIEVRQYVIYVGMLKMNMKNQLEYSNLNFKYEIINLKEIPYQQFLTSAIPEEIPLAILGDFGKDSIKKVLKNIFKSLKSNHLATLEEQKIVLQLDVLSKLRKLQKEIIKLIPNIMALNYNIKEDERYKQGKLEGKTEGRNEERKTNILKLLKADILTVEQIAETLEVSIDYVLELKSEF